MLEDIRYSRCYQVLQEHRMTSRERGMDVLATFHPCNRGRLGKCAKAPQGIPKSLYDRHTGTFWIVHRTFRVRRGLAESHFF